jgi:hypothetical protein
MKKLLFLVVVLFYSTTSIAQETSFFSNTDVFLKKYVHAKKVNYEAIKKDPKTLEDLVKQIATFSLSNPNKFWNLGSTGTFRFSFTFATISI